jgi:Peptidase family M23
MRRLALTSATTLFAFLLLVPPAWAAWVWPLRGDVITPYRNGDDPYASGQHRGIDIAGEVGAPVVAAVGGEVRFAGAAGSSGLTVSIRTDDGRFDTSYLHLSSTAVGEGDRVAAGDRVGAVGTSGARSAAAPHLHFGVRDAASRHAYHDPLGFLPPPPAAPQPPRETPAPQPAPVPPAPAPAPAPAGRRIPVPAPAPRRVPVGAPGARRVPVGAPSPRRVPGGAPSPRRVPAGAPSPRRVPVTAPDPQRVPGGLKATGEAPAHSKSRGEVPGSARGEHRLPGRTPAGSPASAGGLARRPSPAASSEPARQPETGMRPAGPAAAPAPDARTGSGPDLGLVLACLGLLAAAALLGLTQDGQQATRRTGRRIAGVLRPMLGRR